MEQQLIAGMTHYTMISEGASSSRSWAEMAPDALAHIFRRLPLRQLLTIIPCVCKPWKLASLNPLCYQTLDLYPFCKDDSDGDLWLRSSSSYKYDSDGDPWLRSSSSYIGDHLTKVLVARSQGCLLEISYPRFMDLTGLYLVARSAPLLQKLHIPESCADIEWATYAAPLMPHIVDLDVSVCDNELSHEVIEAFGKSCKHMRLLRRNRPSFWDEDWTGSDDSEAVAIAQYYSCLEHLELRCNPLSEKGLQAILDNCPLLEYLDLSGCEYLQKDIDSSFFDKCQAQVKFFKHDFSDEEDSDDYDDFGYEGCYDYDDFGYEGSP